MRDGVLPRVKRRLLRLKKRVRRQPWVVDALNRIRHPPPADLRQNLNALQKRLCAQLADEGAAVIPAAELLGNTVDLSALIGHASAAMKDGMPGVKKDFLVYLWGDQESALDLENPLVRLAVDPALLAVVNAYKGGWAQISQHWAAQSRIMASTAPPARSQRWHRDSGKGDRRLVKVFVYLSEVTDGSGAFEYVPKTHLTGARGRALPYHHEESLYPEDAILKATGLLGGARRLTGKAGTLILCDTTCLHRGGFAVDAPRMVFVAEYVSPNSIQRKYAKPVVNLAEQARHLPRVSRFALGL
jgi:hypothetical protein